MSINYQWTVLLAISVSLVACDRAAAQIQYQNNLQQGQAFGSLGAGANQFGNTQQRFGGPGGIGQNQFGQQGQQGAFGQAGQQQTPPGSAEAMREAFQNMSGRERRRATFNFVVESLNEMRDSRRERDRRRRRPDPIRIQLRPAFTVTPIDPVVLTATLNDNLSKSIELEGSSAVTLVTVEDRRATISGTVSDEHERAVLARMISMQPGVSTVDNQLVVETIDH